MRIIAKPVSRSLAVFHRCRLRFCAGVFVTLSWLGLSAAQAQTTNYVVGTRVLVVGAGAGVGSVVLYVTPPNGVWTATANESWLHLSPEAQNGTGSTNVIFSYDANPSTTRFGTITIGNQTVTITQAASTYIGVDTLFPLVSGGLSDPRAVAVDYSGNVYIADTGDNAIKEWTVANNSVISLVSTGLSEPSGVVVDAAGNVYFSDSEHHALKEWTPSNSNVTTLVSSGLSYPEGVAVDSSGNVYTADFAYGVNTLFEWTAANSNLTSLITSGLNGPAEVALDCARNVYIADGTQSYVSYIKKWTAINSNITILVSSGIAGDVIKGVAVDGSGNAYIAYSYGNVEEWTADNNTLTPLVATGVEFAWAVAVDGLGNVYIADSGASGIDEVPHAFVDPTAKLESLAAGSDTLPSVLPSNENLLPPFAPASDQSWLSITGITNGVVSFSFTVNDGPARRAHINLLGQSILVTQGVIGTPPSLTGEMLLSNGIFQFSFTNIPSGAFTVVSTTDLSLPLNSWTVAGYPVESPPGTYEFTSQPTTNVSHIFYSVISP